HDGKHLDLAVGAAQLDGSEPRDPVGAQERGGRGADANGGTKVFVQRFQARGRVHHAAEGGEVDFVAATDIAHNGGGGFKADAGASQCDCGGKRCLSIVFGGGNDRLRGRDRALDVIVQIQRHIEQREHAVADQLVDHSAVFDHDIGDDRQIAVEHLEHV